MKKINLKILNSAFWIELILAYILPFRVIDNFQYKVGFPGAFLTVYNTAFGVNPLTSMALNPLALLFNVAVIYLIISAAVGLYKKIKHIAPNE